MPSTSKTPEHHTIEKLENKVKSQADSITSLENQIAQLTLKNEKSESSIASLNDVIKSVVPRIAELEKQNPKQTIKFKPNLKQ